MKHYLTTKEIGKILNVNEETVRRWIRIGYLPAENLGGKNGYRVSMDDFELFASTKRAWSLTKSVDSISKAITSSVLNESIGSAIGGTDKVSIIFDSPGRTDKDNYGNETEINKATEFDKITELTILITRLQNSFTIEKMLIEQSLHELDRILKVVYTLKNSIDNK